MRRFYMARFPASAIFIIVLVAALAFGGCCVWSVYAEGTTPTAEFIAAAMKNQEKPGMSLQVRYSWKSKYVMSEKPGVEIEEVRERYYVRTPETIFLKEKVTKNFDPAADTSNLFIANSIVTSSYNRITDEYREMTKFDGLPVEGKATQDVKDMGEVTRVESVVDYIFHMSLLHIVKRGIVLDKREMIDGHSCWGVVRDVVPDVQRHVIWVDPDIGFCPRRIELIGRKQLRRSKTMRDYREIGYGVWFPREVEFEAFSATGQLEDKYTITVDDAKVLPIDPKDKLQVEFPPRASVDYGQAKQEQDP